MPWKNTGNFYGTQSKIIICRRLKANEAKP